MMPEKKKYETPKVTRVRFEDKQVVAMAACNQFLEQLGTQIVGENVVDRFGNPLLTYDPSL
jgi:hypothetical protein